MEASQIMIWERRCAGLETNGRVSALTCEKPARIYGVPTINTKKADRGAGKLLNGFPMMAIRASEIGHL